MDEGATRLHLSYGKEKFIVFSVFTGCQFERTEELTFRKPNQKSSYSVYGCSRDEYRRLLLKALLQFIQLVLAWKGRPNVYSSTLLMSSFIG